MLKECAVATGALYFPSTSHAQFFQCRPRLETAPQGSAVHFEFSCALLTSTSLGRSCDSLREKINILALFLCDLPKSHYTYYVLGIFLVPSHLTLCDMHAVIAPSTNEETEAKVG